MPGINHPPPWLSIVGLGEDGLAGLSTGARRVIETADLLAGGQRHLALVDEALAGTRGSGRRAEHLAWPSPLSGAIPRLLAARGRRVVVLASGDPFWFGIGATLARHVPAREIACWPQPGAFSLAAARLGWALQDCTMLSLHGRPLDALAPHVQPGARLLALTWDGTTPARAAERLTGMGFGPSRLTVLEAMGAVRERCRTARADAFDLWDVDALNTLAIEVEPGPDARPIPLAPGLDDTWFEHDGQITKSEVRALTLAALAPLRGELLWDVGLGSGSVAVEWLLRHPANRAVGIEENAGRAGRAARNAGRLGVPWLEVRLGSAPAALAGLPQPDAVFLGGGAGDPGVFEAAWAALRPGGRLVANAVALGTQARLIDCHARLGGRLVRLSVERATPLGTMQGWRPAMPVMQWSAVKPMTTVTVTPVTVTSATDPRETAQPVATPERP